MLQSLLPGELRLRKVGEPTAGGLPVQRDKSALEHLAAALKLPDPLQGLAEPSLERAACIDRDLKLRASRALERLLVQQLCLLDRKLGERLVTRHGEIIHRLCNRLGTLAGVLPVLREDVDEVVAALLARGRALAYNRVRALPRLIMQ